MPGLDRTGTMGQGAQTGRRMGKCNRRNNQQTENFFRGRGFGKGLGRKMRLRNGWNSTGDGSEFQ